MLLKWEKHVLQAAAIIGISAYPSAVIAFHNGLINLGKRTIDYNVPEEIVEMVESELDKLKNLLMKVNDQSVNYQQIDPQLLIHPELRDSIQFPVIQLSKLRDSVIQLLLGLFLSHLRFI
ncbi:unnamed protein product [Onchocerca flexuosa]|uniref:Cyclin_C domain-containing protein n=1 Tax=Onchocerca flexuosa TaxID=387005 RepID=A0A183HWK5_9BILA|nr:unnamed protein product [Onchocerca flexuosa]